MNVIYDAILGKLRSDAGGGGGGSPVSTTVELAGHGFSVGDVVRPDSVLSWTLAQADTVDNAEALGIVSSITDDTFTLVLSGSFTLVDAVWPDGAVAGDVLFLSATSAGQLTKTEPGGDYISKPIVVCTSTTAGVVVNYRGVSVSDEVFTVTSLPENPSSRFFYWLTQADESKNAPVGVYSYDGTGWSCVAFNAVYDLGEITDDTSLNLISGVKYKVTLTGDVLVLTIAIDCPGFVSITKSGSFVLASPTMTGRTTKLLSSTAWDEAATALCVLSFENDGTYLIISSSELKNP